MYLVGHDDERNVGRAAFVERHRIGDVEPRLSVPFANFGEILALELEKVQRDIGATAFLEADGTRQSDKFHLIRFVEAREAQPRAVAKLESEKRSN